MATWYQGKITYTVRGVGDGKWLCGHSHGADDVAFACAAAEMRRRFTPPRERGRAYPDRYTRVTIETVRMGAA